MVALHRFQLAADRYPCVCGQVDVAFIDLMYILAHPGIRGLETELRIDQETTGKSGVLEKCTFSRQWCIVRGEPRRSNVFFCSFSSLLPYICLIHVQVGQCRCFVWSGWSYHWEKIRFFRLRDENGGKYNECRKSTDGKHWGGNRNWLVC